MPPTPVKQMNPRRRAAVMANIRQQNGERSNRSLAQDWRVTAKNVISEDASEDELRKWQKNPGRFDIQGVDTRLKQRRPATLGIGKPLRKVRTTKKGSDVIGPRPTGIVRNNLRKIWGQVYGDVELGDFDTWISEQSDKTYSEAKADLLRSRGARRTLEMSAREQARHEEEMASHEIELDEQACEYHISECERGDMDDCRIACKECGDDESCQIAQSHTAPKKAKAPETNNAIKIISSNMPDGYEIHKWSYIDRTGKVTAHAVYFEEEPVFDQNKTFKSLTDARKAVKEHADTQRLLKQVRAERAYFEKHGHLGKTGYLPRPKDKE